MRLSKIKLSDISNNFSYYEFKSEDKKYEGSFIEIQKKDNEVSIKVDIFSKIPFYYFVNNKTIYGTTTSEERKQLKEEGIELLSVPWISKDN